MPEDGKPRENPALLDERIENDPVRPEDASVRPEAEAPISDRRRASDETNVHDAGSDANDTMDGLTEQEEAVRRAAEDIPTGADPAGPTEATPVFDRASKPPKL
ncbi:hypothetical protein [Bosea sp. CS1GBMeth4]|uniref:hypothetical protein n=1 Tax=Bosea sp. CS1GBMeth4 TaxID=1892849 RepID=UPI0016487A99|nr:hypothetical protein [Bosea sp. CS1GBMeth4]